MTGHHSHAADDGSLARSTGGAAARGAILIALAVVIGLVLMAFALDDKGTEVQAGGDTGTTTTTESTDNGVTDSTDPVQDGSTTVAPSTIPVDPGDGTPARQPSEVNVLVANGTGGKGIAGALSDKLIAVGYIAKASNAPSTADSVIYYREGYDGDARAVAELLGATPEVILPATDPIAVSSSAVSDGRLEEANVVVIVGNDGKIPTS